MSAWSFVEAPRPTHTLSASARGNHLAVLWVAVPVRTSHWIFLAGLGIVHIFFAHTAGAADPNLHCANHAATRRWMWTHNSHWYLLLLVMLLLLGLRLLHVCCLHLLHLLLHLQLLYLLLHLLHLLEQLLCGLRLLLHLLELLLYMLLLRLGQGLLLCLPVTQPDISVGQGVSCSTQKQQRRCTERLRRSISTPAQRMGCSSSCCRCRYIHTYMHTYMHAYILACQSRASATTNALSPRFITLSHNMHKLSPSPHVPHSPCSSNSPYLRLLHLLRLLRLLMLLLPRLALYTRVLIELPSRNSLLVLPSK